jgi:hypothetical protein
VKRTGHGLHAGLTYASGAPSIGGARARARGATATVARSRGSEQAAARPWLRVALYVGAWLAACALLAGAVDVWVLVHQQDVALHQAEADLTDSLKTAQEGLGKDTAPVVRAQVAAAQARAEATAARRRLDSDWVVRLVQWMPLVHDQVVAIRKVDDVVARAADISLRGEVLLSSFQAARQAPGHGPTVDTAGRFYIANEKEVNAVAGAALDIPAMLEGVDRNRLMPPLRDAMGRLDAPMRQLRNAAPDVRASLAAAPDLLGRDHPAHYLLLFSDNAEVRPGGGYIGTYGLLGFDKGAYARPAIRPLRDLEDPLSNNRAYHVGGTHYFPPWSPQVLTFKVQDTGETMWLRDVDQSVQWPDDARQAERLYESESGQKVDGVIQMDPIAIAYALTVTGPISVPQPSGPAQVVNAANVQQVLLNNTRDPKKAYLGVLEQALNDRLETLPTGQMPDLVKAITKASEQRHLMVYVNTPSAQALIVAHQLDRPVPGPNGDGLIPVFANFAGDKADQYSTRQITITIDAQGNHHLSLLVQNRTPTSQGVLYRGFRELVQFYLPPDATNVRATGFQRRDSLYPGFNLGPLDRGSELGWHIYGGLMIVKPDRDGVVTLDYTRPVPAGPVTFSLVQQPGGNRWQATVEFNIPGLVPDGGGTVDNGVLRWRFNMFRDVTLTARRGAQGGAP